MNNFLFECPFPLYKMENLGIFPIYLVIFIITRKTPNDVIDFKLFKSKSKYLKIKVKLIKLRKCGYSIHK